jgi:hypothetical protein
MGYQVGIQQFKVTFDAPACNHRVTNTDQPPLSKPTKGATIDAAPDADMITFLPRQWTSDGQIAVGFTMAVPQDLLPPRGMTYRYQIAASVTVAVINKDLGMGPNFMHRIATPVSLEISWPAGGAGWPWPQQHHALC